MGPLKRIEWIAKYLLALVAALLLWRPGRKARAGERVATARKILLVRIDDRVGEALLMTPLLATLRQWAPPPEVHLLVHAGAVRVLAGHPMVDRVIGLNRRGLALAAAAPGLRPLRGERYDAVVDCGNWDAPSVTSALVARLAGPRSAVIGPAVFPASALHDLSVDALPDTVSELRQRVNLLSALSPAAPITRTSFRTPQLSQDFTLAARTLVPLRTAILNPGGRLAERRAPTAVFAAAARQALAMGWSALVTWGPGEEGLAREVAALAPGARVAPATNLDELAALVASAGAVICNNTGPMHLAVACSAPTLAFFVRVDPRRWGYPGPPHAMIDLTSDLGAPAAASERAARQTAAFLSALPSQVP